METFTPVIVPSKRKTICISIKNDGTVVVRTPLRVKTGEVDRFLKKKADWIEYHLTKIRRISQQAGDRYSEEDLIAMKEKLRPRLLSKVELYANKIGVTYSHVSIKNQKTRWGSCSSAGNLNFSCLLAEVPESVLDYLVVHELCHRKQMNHSSSFWREVKNYCPDYLQCRKWLRDEGKVLMRKAHPYEEEKNG